MFSILDEIKLKRENLSEKTLKVYLGNLSKMNDKQPIENLDFLKDVKKVESIISEYATPTQRNYIASAMVALSIYDGTDKWEEFSPVYLTYKKMLEDRTSEYNKNIENHAKSKKQEDGWISRKDQLKLINSIRRQLKAMDFDINKPSKMGMKLYQELLVISLYYYMPPRRLQDYVMDIIFTRDNDDGKKNYLLVLNKNKKYFIFNKYKTFKHHGKQEFLVDKKLNKIIEDWLKIREITLESVEQPFIINSKGGALSANGLGKMIKTAFEPTGNKHVTVNILRHVYDSEVIGVEEIEKSKERKKVAEAMGHTVKSQLNYIKV